MRADADLASWLVGLHAVPAGRRVAVVEEPGALLQLRRNGWVDRGTRVFLRAREGYPLPAALDALPLLTGFRGTFGQPGHRIDLDDGYVLQRIPYADAEFRAVELPTELRVWGHEDYSAFLRDFDDAVTDGGFPSHLTNPLTILADEPALGGEDPSSAGIDRRLFVADGGSVSTSPTGPRLGAVDDDPATWAAAIVHRGGDSRAPGGAALGAILSDRDRRDALAERPALRRYLRVVRAQRAARARRRLILRISGFGGRLTPGLPAANGADPVDYPVLASAGSQLWILPGHGTEPELATPEQIAVLETRVCFPDPRDRLIWAFQHLGMTADRYRAVTAALLPESAGLAATAERN